MHILQVVDDFQPELGYQEVFLARELQLLGHQVTVVTSNQPVWATRGLANMPGDSPDIHSAGRRMENGIEVIRLPVVFEFGKRLWLRGLEGTIRSLNAQVVHLHRFLTFTSLRMALLKLSGQLSARLVVDDHMYPAVSQSKLDFLYPLVRNLYSPLMQRTADEIVAVSPTTKQFMIENYGLPSERISTIPLAADVRSFRFDEQARAEVRSTLSIPSDAFAIIYTGKLVEYKRVDILLEAFLRLAPENRNLFLILVGFHDREYVRSLQHRAREASESKRIRWLPGVPNHDLYRYFSAADVAVWPAQHTISILEAMACSLPVIVSDDPRAADEVVHENGLVVSRGSVDELVVALKELISNPWTARDMGRRGLQAVQRHYGWEVVTQQFLQLYQR